MLLPECLGVTQNDFSGIGRSSQVKSAKSCRVPVMIWDHAIGYGGKLARDSDDEEDNGGRQDVESHGQEGSFVYVGCVRVGNGE